MTLVADDRSVLAPQRCAVKSLVCDDGPVPSFAARSRPAIASSRPGRPAAAADLDGAAAAVLGRHGFLRLAPHEGVDDAHRADLDPALARDLDGGEESVQEVRALDQHLLLAPAPAAGREETADVLERVVEVVRIGGVRADRRGDDLAVLQRRPVLDRDDADPVVLDDDGPEAVAVEQHGLELRVVGLGGVEVMDGLLGDHGEERRVDRIGARAQDAALRARLAAAEQEAARIVDVDALRPLAERLAGLERAADARHQTGDLVDADERHLVHPVLERRQRVPAAADHLGQEAGIAVERHGGEGFAASSRAPSALDDAVMRVRNIDEAGAKKDDGKRRDQQKTDSENHMRGQRIRQHGQI